MPRKKQPCIVCGEPTSGVRCKKHTGDKEKFLSLEATRESDGELLAMYHSGMIKSRMAEVLGVSRQSLGKRLGKALERERQRKAADSGMEVEGASVEVVAS